MRVLVMGAALAAAACAPSAAQTPNVDWMAGYWLSCADGVQTAEVWIGAGSGVLASVNLGQDGEARAFEYQRIVQTDAGMAFIAQPGGDPPTIFSVKAVEGQRIIFENDGHDFPQRVIYAREGDVLTGRIEGVIDGQDQAMEWRFQRAALDANCPAPT